MRLEIQRVADVWERLRQKGPLVHCLTNQVVKNFTANALLACGAAPAMVEHPLEARQFAAIADALLINLGTFDDALTEAAKRAIAAANAAKRPWVLDPVAVGVLDLRTDFARGLLYCRPTVIRGNASEILALAGEGSGGRGVDATDEALASLPAARELARRCGGAVLVTGPVDYVTDGREDFSIANGHPLLTRVTGVGCAQGALIAACAAVAESSLEAAATAALAVAVAGELAAKEAKGPGSFQIALLDALDALEAQTLLDRAHLAPLKGGE